MEEGFPFATPETSPAQIAEISLDSFQLFSSKMLFRRARCLPHQNGVAPRRHPVAIARHPTFALFKVMTPYDEGIGGKTEKGLRFGIRETSRAQIPKISLDSFP
jgi:hypothetical protein